MLRKKLDQLKPHFDIGGKLEKYYPIYDMIDSFLYTPDTKTSDAPHIRDAIDLKRSMVFVVIAMIPVILFGIFNVGYQQDPNRAIFDNFIIGLQVVVPIIIVSYSVGGLWEILFAIVRKHEVNEGFLVTGMLIPMVMPPTIPLWMVAVATSFGVVIGKEIFGGTGYNIFNPALVARAFIFFAYPAQISGDLVWKVDGISAATPLLTAASEQGTTALQLLNDNFTFLDMFYGFIPGSIGETSTLACLLGGFFLLITRIGNWRIMSGVILGMIFTAFLTNQLAEHSTNPMLSLPPHYHFVMGGFAFGMVYMATEPVTGAHTNPGRWIYGFLIGFLVVIIRAINPAYPEGMMLSILFANAFAPLIDYFIIQKHIRKRQSRYAH